MALLVLCDPRYYGGFWCGTKLRGIYDEAARRRIPVKLYTDMGAFREAAVRLGPDSSVILLFDRIPYLEAVIEMLAPLSLHPILSLTEQDFRMPGGYSQVAGDVDSATKRMVAYLHACGKRRIALVGMNRHSAASRNKAEMLRRHVPPEEHRVFCVGNAKNALESSFAEFYAVRDQFDAVMCVNDHQAICLIEYLKARGAYDPAQFIISHGGTIMARLYDRGITTIGTSFYDCGRTAVEIHVNRLKYNWSATRTLLNCEITFRGTTDVNAQPLARKTTDEEPKEASLFTVNFGRIERMLGECDLANLKLLYGLLSGYSYEKLGEFCYFSADAAKYRVRKLRQDLGCANRESAVSMISTYIDKDNLLRTIGELEGTGGKVFLK